MKNILLLICFCSNLLGFSQEKAPLLIAHRGGILANIPENSLLAFQHCMDTNVAMIETDVRLSKDHKMVLFHDASLQRMTGNSKKLANCTLAELQELSLGQLQKIPTLQEALVLVKKGNSKLLLDIKAGERLDYQLLFQLLEKHQLKQQVCIGVRTLEELKTCKKLDANVQVLGFIPEPEQTDVFILHKVNAIRLWPNWLEDHPTLVTDLAKKNIPIWMTVKAMETPIIKQLVQQGASGFIHDNPQKVRKEF
ncbi:glycerophosphoryl diester phosphodiesterase [Wenyingzhuangia heitensis]|uniref:Glycerophosphoryl diester phosphodiesterase n=1 Tax=Wenyingzhuangia heitensis TaxID=1487859 RepID=A0ABX0UDI9_9FLAO|nr:glycerophosphodiester phosphodiesterase family protein [Wenyingzhuangia heitensis]NIJ46404.1 glycerophosphoryl diester phosphodiesterase [Wenyingzhuangia heitensis]